MRRVSRGHMCLPHIPTPTTSADAQAQGHGRAELPAVAFSQDSVYIIYTGEAQPVWESDVNARIEWSMNKAVEDGFLKSGDSVVAVHGWKGGSSATNTVRVLMVP